MTANVETDTSEDDRGHIDASCSELDTLEHELNERGEPSGVPGDDAVDEMAHYRSAGHPEHADETEQPNIKSVDEDRLETSGSRTFFSLGTHVE